LAGGAASPHAKRRRTLAPLLTASRAARCVFLVVDNTVSTPHALHEMWAKASATSTSFTGVACAVIGIALVSWKLRAFDEDNPTDVGDILQRSELKKTQAANQCGFLDYVAEEILLFDSLRHTSVSSLDVDGISHIRSISSNATYMQQAYVDYLDDRNIPLPSDVVRISNNMADMLAAVDTHVIACILISSRIANKSRFIPDFPKLCVLTRFKAFQNARILVNNALSPQHEGPLLALPSNAAKLVSPSERFGSAQSSYSAAHYLKILRMNRHLRSTVSFEESIKDALEYAIDEPDDLQRALDNTPKAPHHVNIRRARLRLDAMGNNIRRRHMQDLAKNHPDDVLSAHLFF
jgi:hypothetical protein